MNLTEWIIKEDLSIKEFAEEFVNVVKENFGEHNYKCVTDIVNNHLANGVDARTEPALPLQNVVHCKNFTTDFIEDEGDGLIASVNTSIKFIKGDNVSFNDIMYIVDCVDIDFGRNLIYVWLIKDQ